MADLKRRLEKLETAAEAKEGSNRPTVQVGYVQELPKEYEGERHVVVVSHVTVDDTFGKRYEWEERPGPDPNPSERQILRVCIKGGVPYRIGDWGKKHGEQP
jgi:hypothetical protein